MHFFKSIIVWQNALMENDPQFDFRQIPFVRLLVPFVMGIGTLSLIPKHWSCLNLIVLSAIVVIATIHYFQIFKNYTVTFKAILVFTILFWGGMLSFYSTNQHAVLPLGKAGYVTIVYRQPSHLHMFNTIDCQTISYESDKKIIHLKENIRIYCKADLGTPLFQTGDTLYFEARVAKCKNGGNPGEFDFAKHMSVDGIYYMTFLTANNIHAGGDSHKYPIKRLAAKIQQTLIQKFEECSIQGDELAVISALVAGNTERLDKEIRASYSASGAMHILAVSGWHIGILFLFLNLIIGKRNNRFYFNLFRMVIILLAIWLYTFITGLSPSVMRSAVMFSLFLIGKGFRRQTNSFNVLAASALIILTIEPNEIFMAGFQLSYLAVFGILFFQPRLNKLASFQKKTVNKIWQLLTVSMAAQLVTFPFSLFYFHQFPNYFWLSNLLIIPLVWVIMIITVLFFCTLPFISLAKTVAFILGIALKIMNSLIGFIPKLPFSIVGNIRFELFHLVVCSALVFIIILLLFIRWAKYIFPVAGIALTILLSFEIGVYNADNKKTEIIVYNIDKGFAISLISGHRHLLLVDSLLMNNLAEFNQANVDFWRNRQIGKIMRIINLSELEEGIFIRCKEIKLQQTEEEFIIDFKTKRICVVNKKNKCERQNYKNVDCFNSDYIIVCNSQDKASSSLLKKCRTKEIIIAGEVSNKTRNALIKLAAWSNIGIHDIKTSGALHIIY